MKPQIIRSDY